MIAAVMLGLAATAGGPADTVVADACPMIPVEQLRFVVTAGLGRTFPLRESVEGTTVTIADPRVESAACPHLRVEVQVTIREEPAGASPAVIQGTARLSLTLSAMAAFAARAGKPIHTAATLLDAELCVRKAEPANLSVKGASPGLTAAWLGSRLGPALAGRACFDITSLVYVFLQRGGILSG